MNETVSIALACEPDTESKHVCAMRVNAHVRVGADLTPNLNTGTKCNLMNLAMSQNPCVKTA